MPSPKLTLTDNSYFQASVVVFPSSILFPGAKSSTAETMLTGLLNLLQIHESKWFIELFFILEIKRPVSIPS